MSRYQLMLRGFSGALICGFLLVAGARAQEVIVARETKPEAAKPPPPQLELTPSPPEQAPSESPTPTPKESKPRERKSHSKTMTLEEMRMAGARAAERLNNPPAASPTKSLETESERVAREAPLALPSATPGKKEPREENTTSRRSSTRSGKPDSLGAVRPTMMETGRQEPNSTPLPKWQGSTEQTPAP